MDVTSDVGLTTDRDLAVPPCLRNTTFFLYPRNIGNHVVEPLYSGFIYLSFSLSIYFAHSFHIDLLDFSEFSINYLNDVLTSF